MFEEGTGKLKIIVAGLGLSTLVLVFAWTHILSPGQCFDQALIKSSLYTTTDPDHFEIKFEEKSGIIPQLTYLVSMQEIPLKRVRLSSLGCRLLGENSVTFDEIDSLFAN